MTASPHVNPVTGLQGPIAVLLNAGGGTATRLGCDTLCRQIVDAFARRGVTVEPIRLEGGAVEGAARAKLAAGTFAAVIVGGGDGTMNAAAQILAGSKTPLGILPLGTYNHFARDLCIPLDLDAAVATIVEGHIAEIDVGEVNGRVFVNNSSIGVYPELVRDRDRQRRKNRRHKMLALLLALYHVLRHPPVRRLQIEAQGWAEPHKTSLAFVGNNLYSTDLFAPRHRIRLSDGTLCLFIASPNGPFGVMRLLLRAALGWLDQDRDFEMRQLRRLVIRSHRRRVKVSLDGEVVILRAPLHYRIRPRVLRVLVPAPESGA